MNKAMQLGAALGGAALVVAAGSAYTASITGMPPTALVGVDTTTVTGGTISSVAYDYSADGTKMTKVTYVMNADVPAGSDIFLTQTGGGSETASCVPEVGNLDNVVCTVTNAGWDAEGLTELKLVINQTA